MTAHRSTAYVESSEARHHWRKPEPITNQFRFIVRMAYACHEHQVPYDLAWNIADGVMRATITATGNIPTPRPLPKAPRLKIVADWKPAIWDAAYRLEAYHDGTLNRMHILRVIFARFRAKSQMSARERGPKFRYQFFRAAGCGISRSTISKSAPALGTCAAFIFAICGLSSKCNPFKVKIAAS
jgi:hypothetical protein